MGTMTTRYVYGKTISLTSSAEDALTTAWVNAVVGDGGTVSSGRRTTVNTLIAGLRTDGLISKLDRLWIFAAENSQSALRDLIAAALAVPHDATGGGEPNKPTFTTDRGYASTSGGDGYIDTGFNAATAGGNYAQDSAHLSIWNLTNTADDAHPSVSVNNASTTGENIYTSLSSNCYLRINDASEAAGLSITDPRGHILGNRSSSSARQAYQNGSVLGTYGAITSQALISGNFVLLDRQATTGTSSPFQLSMFSCGGSLSSTDTTNFYNRLRTYMTAVGVP